MNLVVIIIVMFLLGVVIGMLLQITFARSKSIGTLRIDMSDEDGPYLFLELSKGTHAIRNESYVVMRVDDASYLSRN